MVSLYRKFKLFKPPRKLTITLPDNRACCFIPRDQFPLSLMFFFTPVPKSWAHKTDGHGHDILSRPRKQKKYFSNNLALQRHEVGTTKGRPLTPTKGRPLTPTKGRPLTNKGAATHTNKGAATHTNKGAATHTNKGAATHTNKGAATHTNKGAATHTNKGAATHTNKGAATHTRFVL